MGLRQERHSSDPRRSRGSSGMSPRAVLLQLLHTVYAMVLLFSTHTHTHTHTHIERDAFPHTPSPTHLPSSPPRGPPPHACHPSGERLSRHTHTHTHTHTYTRSRAHTFPPRPPSDITAPPTPPPITSTRPSPTCVPPFRRTAF